MFNSFPDKETKLWFTSSSAEDISKLAEILNNNATKKLKWKYSDEPNKKHSTILKPQKKKL